MKATQIFLALALLTFVLIAFTPQEAQGSRRVLLKLKKAALALLLLKKAKKTVFALPVPLPIPIPILKERIPVAEVEPVYSAPASYAESSYGGGDGY